MKRYQHVALLTMTLLTRLAREEQRQAKRRLREGIRHLLEAARRLAARQAGGGGGGGGGQAAAEEGQGQPDGEQRIPHLAQEIDGGAGDDRGTLHPVR